MVVEITVQFKTLLRNRVRQIVRSANIVTSKTTLLMVIMRMQVQFRTIIDSERIKIYRSYVNFGRYLPVTAPFEIVLNLALFS